MRRQLTLGLTMIIGGLVTISLIVILTRLSPIATTLAALFLLVLLLTFVMPELTLHIIVLAMLLSPEVALTEVPGTRGGHAELTLRIEDFLLMFLGMGWLARLAIFKEVTQITRSPINGPLGAYVGACILSTLIGIVMGKVSPMAGGLYLLKYFEYYFLYYMVIMTVDDESQVRRLMTTFFITAAIIVGTAIAQIPSGLRVTAPFEGGGEPNTLGGYVVVVIGMALGFLSHSNNYWANLAWSAFAFVLLVPLGYTLSRVSWLAMVPLAITYFILNYRRRILMVTLGTLLTVTLVLILAPANLRDRVDSRIEETFTPGVRSEQVVESVFGIPLDESTSLRIRRYKEVLEVVARSPLFGDGITGWGLSDAMYPRILGETGVLGLAAFLWLLFRIAQENRRVARHFTDHPSSPLFQGIISGQLLALAALTAHAGGADTFVIVRIMEPFWLITALTFVLPYVRTTSEPAVPEEPHPASELPVHGRHLP